VIGGRGLVDIGDAATAYGVKAKYGPVVVAARRRGWRQLVPGWRVIAFQHRQAAETRPEADVRVLASHG